MDAELALAAFRIFDNLSLFRLIRLALEDGVAVPIDNPEANIFEFRDKFLLLKATIDSLDFNFRVDFNEPHLLQPSFC